MTPWGLSVTLGFTAVPRFLREIMVTPFRFLAFSVTSTMKITVWATSCRMKHLSAILDWPNVFGALTAWSQPRSLGRYLPPPIHVPPRPSVLTCRGPCGPCGAMQSIRMREVARVACETFSSLRTSTRLATATIAHPIRRKNLNPLPSLFNLGHFAYQTGQTVITVAPKDAWAPACYPPAFQAQQTLGLSM